MKGHTLLKSIFVCLCSIALFSSTAAAQLVEVDPFEAIEDTNKATQDAISTANNIDVGDLKESLIDAQPDVEKIVVEDVNPGKIAEDATSAIPSVENDVNPGGVAQNAVANVPGAVQGAIDGIPNLGTSPDITPGTYATDAVESIPELTELKIKPGETVEKALEALPENVIPTTEADDELLDGVAFGDINGLTSPPNTGTTDVVQNSFVPNDVASQVGTTSQTVGSTIDGVTNTIQQNHVQNVDVGNLTGISGGIFNN